METTEEDDMSNCPNITQEDVALLEEILSASGDWMLSRVIAYHPTWMSHNAKMTPSHSERKIRAIANFSGGSIVSHPGSAGYKLRSCCTPEEIETAIRKLLHQASEMTRRAYSIEQFDNKQRQGQLV
jgi:hypothetical protein